MSALLSISWTPASAMFCDYSDEQSGPQRAYDMFSVGISFKGSPDIPLKVDEIQMIHIYLNLMTCKSIVKGAEIRKSQDKAAFLRCL